MSRSTRLLLALAACSVAGCAGMSEAQCRSADWRALGVRDALDYGLRPQVDQYQQQCAAFGVQIAEKDYLTGWKEGDAERAVRLLGGGPI
jgi:hypothetical protein